MQNLGDILLSFCSPLKSLLAKAMRNNNKYFNLRGVYTTEQKWHGSDKNWNGSNSFCKETVKFYPFRVGSTGAYGPVAERIKLHCFFAKTIGTVQVFVGSVPFLLCRVNAPLFLFALNTNVYSAVSLALNVKVNNILCLQSGSH